MKRNKPILLIVPLSRVAEYADAHRKLQSDLSLASHNELIQHIWNIIIQQAPKISVLGLLVLRDE